MPKEETIVDWGAGLAVVVDRPKRSSCRRVALVCHGLTGDKTGPGGLLRQLGESLADHGWHAYRWDLPGAADSGGRLEELGFTQMVESVYAMAEVALADHGTGPVELALIGHSMGAIVATAAAEAVHPDQMVLIATDLLPGHRITVPPDRSIRAGAFRLAPEFWQQRREVDPVALLRDSDVPTLVIAPGNDTNVVSALSKTERIRWEVVAGANHLFTELDHRAELCLRTNEYLDHSKEK